MSELNSCLYTGTVMHHRFSPTKNRFSYRVFCMCLDLDELVQLDQQRYFSVNRFNLFSFNETEHGSGQGNLANYIRQLLTEKGYDNATHQIRLLCYPRIFGYTFNPISTYFCYNRAGEVAVILYEVSNTFSSRHTYLFQVDSHSQSDTKPIQHTCDKQLYVSPFMPMQTTYNFSIQPPAKRVAVCIRQVEKCIDSNPSQPILDANFNGVYRPFTDRSLLVAFWKYPLMTLKVTCGIHWEALNLWRKKLAIQPRLKGKSNSLSWQDKTGESHYERL